MSKIQDDIKMIEDYLNSPSPKGMFLRKEEPKYHTLLALVESSANALTKAEHVYNMRKIQHMLATAELQAFVNGEELDADKVQEIKDKIQVFITEYINGEWR